MQITISGVAVSILANSLQLPDAIEQRSVLSFTVEDPTGAGTATSPGTHYRRGQPVTFTDDTGVLRYTGVIDSASEVKPGPASDTTLWTTVTCADPHYFADKRIAATSYTNQQAGYIVNDLITQYLAAEGVLGARTATGGYKRGINSFGADAGSVFPGTYDVDYHYDGLASHQYYASRGHQVVRLPFKWERIQPTRGAALDTTELGRLTTAVSNIHSAGMQAILDVHNYCRRVESGVTKVMGTDFPVSDLSDLWTRLSTAFKGNAGIYAYGLMNEPHDLQGTPATITPAATVYDFEAGTQGWKSDDGATVAQSTAAGTFHDGAASLSLTRGVGGANTNFIRADDNAGQAALTDANGTYLGVWVLIPAGTPGTGWSAHLELYDASFSPVAGPDAPLTVGTWTQIAAGFSTALWASHKNIAVQINAPSGVTATVTVYIDTVQQGTGTPGETGAQVWEAASQTVLSAIRANSDTTLILVPGYGYSEAAYWYYNHPNGLWITDSANNYLYDAHYYFDYSDGNAAAYPNDYATENADAQAAGYGTLTYRATQGLTVWLNWLKNFSAPGGFLSEIGWPGGIGSYTADADAWNAVGNALYALLDTHGIGATYWAGGEFWGYETYNLQAYSIAAGVSNTVGPVSLALAQAAIIEAHLSLPATISDGPTLPAIIFNYATVSACLDELAKQAGYVWWIDAQKRLWFQARTASAAPWALTADTAGVVADALAGSVTVVNGNPAYRNTQYLTNVTNVTVTQTETRIGDSHTTAWTMGYDLNAAPTITVNGVAKTVGILGTDTGKDFYWKQGSNAITQDSAGTKLISTDTLQVVYVGQYVTVLVSEDTSAVMDRQTVEGGGTGQVEEVETQAQGSTLTQAYTTAAALLAEYAVIGRTLTFSTYRSGLYPGQLLTVTIPAHNLASAQMLIESVTISDVDGQKLLYVVKAIEGPVLGDWTKFFLRLAGQAQPQTALINVGQSGTLVIVASMTAQMKLIASINPTVYVCPIIGPSTIIGPSLIVC